MTGSIRTDMETTFTRRNSHGANLKRWREWRGIKQEVLADKIGVSQATLSGYEKKDELEPEVLEKIYHLSLSSDNISRDIDILSRGLMVYQQAVSLFCLRMINTEINGNSKSISSKGLFRDD